MTDMLFDAALALLVLATAYLVWQLTQAVDALRLDVSEAVALLEDEAGAWEFTPDEDDDEREYMDSGTYTWSRRHE